MTRREYRKNKMRFQLEERRGKRIPSVIWKLDKEQCEILDELGYTTKPLIYEVTTRPFQNIRWINNSLVRDVHYACKRGRRVIYLRAKERELEVLKDFGIKFKPYKYEIKLTPR